MMTSCFPIIEFILFTLVNLRSNERKFYKGVRLRSRLRVSRQCVRTSPIHYLLKSLHAGYDIAIVLAIKALPTGCFLYPAYRATLLFLALLYFGARSY